MGRWKAWALAWLLAATLSALLLQAPSARGDELLANRGFEDGTAVPWTAEGGELQAEDGFGRDGSFGGVFATDDSLHHYVEQCVSVWEGNAYAFQGYAKAGSETPPISAFLGIHWYGQPECFGKRVDADDTSDATILETPDSWQSLVLEIGAAPAGSRSARVGIVIEESNVTVYLDDFSFTGPPAPTPIPSPTPSPTVSPSSTASPSPTASPTPEPTTSPTPTPVASPSPAAVPIVTEVPSAPAASPSASTLVGELVNGGFEEADDEGKPLGWQKYGGALGRSSIVSQEGQYAAAFTSRTTSTKWVFQTVAVQGGEAYVLSGYALKNDANVGAAYLRVSWYTSPDASGGAIDIVDSTTRLTDNSPYFRFLTTEPVLAPVEAASAKVRLMLDPVSESEGRVYFDAISFEETTMPPPTQTPVPSPSPKETATPLETAQAALSPTAGDGQAPAPSAAVPAVPPEDVQSPSSPTASRPSSLVLDAMGSSSETIASSPDEPWQGDANSEARPARTPVVLYRERKSAQSIQAGQDLAGRSNEGDGLSPIVLSLAMAMPAALGAAAAFFVWRRWQKGARPP